MLNVPWPSSTWASWNSCDHCPHWWLSSAPCGVGTQNPPDPARTTRSASVPSLVSSTHRCTTSVPTGTR